MQLPSAVIAAVLPRIVEELGRSDRDRMRGLQALLAPDGSFNLGTAIATLYPEKDAQAGLAALGQLRIVVKNAALAAKMAFDLQVDSRKRNAPADRTGWFSGNNPTVAQIDAIADAGTALARRSEQEAVLLPEGVQLPSDKRVIRYFVSYAHDNPTLVEDLLTRLRRRFASAARFEFREWNDRNIDAGVGWHDAIQTAIQECHFGLLMVSHAFLASNYITKEELHHFVPNGGTNPAATKRAVPLAIEGISFDGETDLKGLERIQFLPRSNQPVYEACRGNPAKNNFASAVFKAIIGFLDKLPDPSPHANPTKETLRLNLEMDPVLRRANAFAASGSMEKLDPALDGERRDVMDLLQEWLADANGKPYSALLGDYGMGKTTTCMALTQDLLRRREAGETLPQPIYFDLRKIGDGAKVGLLLPEIIDRVLARSWQSGSGPVPPAAEVIRLVQQDGALAIFDGLDEVLVHLSPTQGQHFTREIFRILPPALVVPRKDRAAQVGTPGRLLVTCRTHFFRTLRDQKTFLTAEGRDHVSADLYQVMVLLPFGEEEIRQYLTLTLRGDDEDSDVTAEVARIYDLIAAVHNLRELAQRPYLLSLISAQAAQLERWKLEGRRVSGVDLYRDLVLSWLERDGGKHTLTPPHKQMLMERIAASLYRDSASSWGVDALEAWLIDFMTDNPRIAAHYDGVSRDLMKEDLRTATFLVREGEDRFRFAHTSMQEFFLAGFLHRALRDARPDDWALPAPSEETLDFLGQMIGGDAPAQATLQAMFDRYRPQASELALCYTALARGKQYFAPRLAGAQLQGAQLEGIMLGGTPDQWLDLRGANFAGADLRFARLANLDLTGADFSGACLVQIELIGASAADASFIDAALGGATLRDADLAGARFGGARTAGLEMSRCVVGDARDLLPVPRALGEMLVLPPDRGAVPQLLDGHALGVTSVAVSPDGARIVSGSDDGSVRVWDAKAARCVAVLEGHSNAVTSVAFAPDGGRILSGSEDRSVRVWDAMAGCCVAVLEGHAGVVTSVAFAPDGARIVSGAWDNSVRVWDAKAARCVAVLEGHSNWVTSVAFSPDGGRIVSGSYDRSVRVWDAKAARCVAVLEGHSGGVNAVAFAPDGARIVSGAWDNSVRVWDAKAARCVAVLEGHSDWVASVAFAPDGGRIVSGSYDRSVRVWDAKAARCVAVLEGHSSLIASVALSPDGARIVSGSSDKSVRVWDAKAACCVAVLEGHSRWVTSVAFAPDGVRIVSGSWDSSVRVWDAKAARCVAVLEGHSSAVTSVAFAPDGAHIVSTDFAGKSMSWNAATFVQEAGPRRQGRKRVPGLAAARQVAANGTHIRVAASTRNGDDGMLIYPFDNGAYAILSEDGSRLLGTGGDAWRYLRWVRTAENGDREILLAEAFGPLPT